MGIFVMHLVISLCCLAAMIVTSKIESDKDLDMSKVYGPFAGVLAIIPILNIAYLNVLLSDIFDHVFKVDNE